MDCAEDGYLGMSACISGCVVTVVCSEFILKFILEGDQDTTYLDGDGGYGRFADC